MAIELRIDKAAGLAELNLSAPLSVNAFRSALDELVAHPEFSPGMNMLAVIEPGCVAHMSLVDMCSISDYETSRAEQLGSDYRLALVVSSDVDFGKSRMYQTCSQHFPREFRIFRSLAEARAWVTADAPATGVRTRKPPPRRQAASLKK